jgi:hypothetical protein
VGTGFSRESRVKQEVQVKAVKIRATTATSMKRAAKAIMICPRRDGYRAGKQDPGH